MPEVRNRFYIQMRRSENDIFLSAALSGHEEDFLDRIRQQLVVRHRGVLCPDDVTGAFKVT